MPNGWPTSQAALATSQAPAESTAEGPALRRSARVQEHQERHWRVAGSDAEDSNDEYYFTSDSENSVVPEQDPGAVSSGGEDAAMAAAPPGRESGVGEWRKPTTTPSGPEKCK